MNKETIPGNKLISVDVQVRWSDLDALGHVNNAMYFSYFEIARLAWYASLGHGSLGSESTGLVIVDAHCEYLHAILYPATIAISMYGGVPGRSSFDSFYRITDSSGHVLYTRGSSRIVWLDKTRTRSSPLPAGVRAMLPET